MHIGYKICHFLLLNVTITDTRKNKNMGKTGLYGMSPCRGSTVTYFSFYGVSKTPPKTAFFGAYTEPPKMILLPKWAPENALFWVIFGHPIKQKICYSTPPTWGHTIEASFPHIFIFFWSQ